MTEKKELTLAGVISLKGKKVKLYIDSLENLDPILLAEFEGIGVDIPIAGQKNTPYKWKVIQGIIYGQELELLPKSLITSSLLPDGFSLEFTLESVEYAKDYHGERWDVLEDEPLLFTIGGCSAVIEAFRWSNPSDKTKFTTKWEGQGEWLWRLDGKKWG